jgi:hypothetical protein
MLAVIEHEQHCLACSEAISSGIGSSERISRPSASTSAPGTWRGSRICARSTNRTPWSYPSISPSATARATVDLPIPPGPTMVMKRRPRQLRRERPHPVAAVDHARDWRWQIVHARSGGPRRRTWLLRAGYRSDNAITLPGNRSQIIDCCHGDHPGLDAGRRPGPSGCPPRRTFWARREPSARSCPPARPGARPRRSGFPGRDCRGARAGRRAAGGVASAAGGTVQRRPRVRSG